LPRGAADFVQDDNPVCGLSPGGKTAAEREPAATAVSQLRYPGAEIAEWLFRQEKATLENAEKGTGIVKPL